MPIATHRQRSVVPFRSRGGLLRMGQAAATILAGILLAACMAQGVVVVGEAPVPPPGATGMVAIQILDDRGDPLIGAQATASEILMTSDEAGQVRFRWAGEPITVTVRSEGFFPAAVAVEEHQEEPLELVLRPAVLRGSVVDRDQFGVAAAQVSLGDAVAVTDQSGRFEISRASAGTITVTRPGWQDTEFFWDGLTLMTEIELEPRFVRGLHIGQFVYIDPQQWQDLLQVADDTVVNAFVIDAKDESGRVFYPSEVPLANQVGAVDPLIDLDRVVADMDRHQLYKIARIVTFQDPIAARGQVDLAIYDTTTGGPYNKNDQYFLDPTDPYARAYALHLAEEVCAAGFDEIQFDYVRFPDGFPHETTRFDGGSSEEVRVETITGFLREAADRLHPLGCVTGADIFGFITTVRGDGGIGQEYGALTEVVDVLSPMVYPSHYSRGWFGFDKPNDHPGEVVAGALEDALDLGRRQGSAIVRPWLQDFYYNPAQVREGIRAAEASGASGWMLWNARSRFQLEALDAEPAAAGGTGSTG